ncbi:hypothetical protein ACSBR2_008675 [Camellia fascicularis]
MSSMQLEMLFGDVVFVWNQIWCLSGNRMEISWLGAWVIHKTNPEPKTSSLNGESLPMQPVYFAVKRRKICSISSSPAPFAGLSGCRFQACAISECLVILGRLKLTGPVFMIQLKFRRLEIPPNYNVDHLGCIGGCDEILKQLVEICGTGSRNLSTTPARGRGTATSSSSAQRSNSRQIACTHCRQYGHSSNDCPSQTSRSSRAPSQGMNQQSDNAGESSIPCDTCGTPCILRTANTESNRGRKFYSCQS